MKPILKDEKNKTNIAETVEKKIDITAVTCNSIRHKRRRMGDYYQQDSVNNRGNTNTMRVR